MFQKTADLQRYVEQNYPEVTDKRIDEGQWDLYCTHCKIVRGFQVTTRTAQQKRVRGAHGNYEQVDVLSPVSYWFVCPVCKGFKQWLLFEWS